MITMVLGGLWHGAAWPFVFWGFYQGALLVVFRFFGERLGPKSLARLDRPIGKVFATMAMFHLTCYGWLLFRSRSAGQVTALTSSLVSGWGQGSPELPDLATRLAFYALPLLVLHGWEAMKDDVLAIPRLPVGVRYSVYVALAYLTVLFGEFGGSQFIYFQF